MAYCCDRCKLIYSQNYIACVECGGNLSETARSYTELLTNGYRYTTAQGKVKSNRSNAYSPSRNSYGNNDKQISIDFNDTPIEVPKANISTSSNNDLKKIHDGLLNKNTSVSKPNVSSDNRPSANTTPKINNNTFVHNTNNTTTRPQVRNTKKKKNNSWWKPVAYIAGIGLAVFILLKIFNFI